MFTRTNILRYRRALQRLIAVCGAIVFLLAVIVNQAVTIHESESVIKSLTSQIYDSEQRVIVLTGRVEELEAQLDAERLETAISRGGDRVRLSLEEMRMLAGTVYAEARGESDLGKMLVARVALNRVRWNPGMTLKQILHKPNQFATGTEYTNAEMQAVYRALADTDYSHLAGFHNPDTSTSDEIHSKRILLKVGKHVFW